MIALTTTPTSSAIHSVGYDAVAQTLAVAWRKKGSEEPGPVYYATPVGELQYNEIMAAPSLGAKINALRKDPSITWTKVNEYDSDLAQQLADQEPVACAHESFATTEEF